MLRLLVVTYYFPPSGGGGVQRPTKWVKYLPEAGVQPTVLTVREGAYPHLDPTQMDDVPAGVEVVRTAAPDPFGLYGRLTGRSRDEAVAARTGRVGESPSAAERAARWVRANVFVPDARVGWVPFAARAARRLHRERPFDAVLTTGPPHSAHLVGRVMHRLGARWVADFRDPWTDIHYQSALSRSGAAARLDARLEAAVLREADAVLTVSEPLARGLQAKARVPVHVIPNGFDPDDFPEPAPPVRSDRFVVTHVGTLHGVPMSLLDAIARLRAEGEEVGLRCVGSVPEDLLTEAETRGVADLVEVEGAVPHDEAVAIMRRSPLLLLTVEPWDYAEGVLPGKTFEYLASGRPVLGLGPVGAASRVLVETGAGVMLRHGDVDGVAAELLRHRGGWQEGRAASGARTEAVATYSRVSQARHVAEVVRSVRGGGERARGLGR